MIILTIYNIYKEIVNVKMRLNVNGEVIKPNPVMIVLTGFYLWILLLCIKYYFILQKRYDGIAMLVE